MDEVKETAANLAAKSLIRDPELFVETNLFTATEMLARGAPPVPVEVRVIRQLTIEALQLAHGANVAGMVWAGDVVEHDMQGAPIRE